MQEFIKKLFNEWWRVDFLGIALISFSFLIFPLLIHNSVLVATIGIPVFGLYLTYYFSVRKEKTQNRQWQTENKMHMLQLKSSFRDRYEKVATMLGNEVMAVRIAGCQALTSLAIDDEKMKVQCILLLFAFIKNPYLGDDEKKSAHGEHEKNEKLDDPTKFAPLARLSKSKLLEYVFPSYEILRDDIQEAADSFSAIYEKYKDEGIYIEKVILPNYFLQNEKKKPISLMKANLSGMNFEGAYLEMVKLQGADLVNANLIDAKLMFADMSGANLIEAEFIRANLDQADLSNAKLHRANLSSVQLFNADLSGANFSHANLYEIELYGANLSDAKLNGANISNASMHRTTGLTKEQILSAVWGYDESGEGEPPSFLPEELENDPEVKKWLAKPHFDKSKKKDS